MKRESSYSAYRFMREWQYVWLEYFAHMQGGLVGGGRFVRRAGVWDWLRGLPQKFLGKLARRETKAEGAFETYEENVFHSLQDDWNSVYVGENYKATVLGMIAEEFQRRGVDPERIRGMGLNDVDAEMRERGYGGLDDLDEWLDRTGWKKSQYYAQIWAETQGAKWLAVYDENGRRSGRAYEVVTGMYRDVLAEANARDEPPDKLRQALLYADDASIKARFLSSDGVLDEAAYQGFIEKHLSRDMVRFAVTETAINFNNGKLLQMLHEGGEYVCFSGGG